VSFGTVVDALLVAAWITLAADNLLRARRERAARARLGPVVGGGSAPGLAMRLAVLAVLLGCGALLEARTGGRLAFHPVAAIAGLALAATGVALHLRDVIGDVADRRHGGIEAAQQHAGGNGICHRYRIGHLLVSSRAR